MGLAHSRHGYRTHHWPGHHPHYGHGHRGPHGYPPWTEHGRTRASRDERKDDPDSVARHGARQDLQAHWNALDARADQPAAGAGDEFQSAASSIRDGSTQRGMLAARNALVGLPPDTYDLFARSLDAPTLEGTVHSTHVPTADEVIGAHAMGTAVAPRCVVVLNRMLHVLDMRTARLTGTLALGEDERVYTSCVLNGDTLAIGVGGLVTTTWTIVRIRLGGDGVPRRVGDGIVLQRYAYDPIAIARVGPNRCVISGETSVELCEFAADDRVHRTVVAVSSDVFNASVMLPVDVGCDGYFGVRYGHAIDEDTKRFELFELDAGGAVLRLRLRAKVSTAMLLHGERSLATTKHLTDTGSDDMRVWPVPRRGAPPDVPGGAVVHTARKDHVVSSLVALDTSREHVAVVQNVDSWGSNVRGSAAGEVDITGFAVTTGLPGVEPMHQTVSVSGLTAHAVLLPTRRLAVVTPARGGYTIHTLAHV